MQLYLLEKKKITHKMLYMLFLRQQQRFMVSKKKKANHFKWKYYSNVFTSHAADRSQRCSYIFLFSLFKQRSFS